MSAAPFDLKTIEGSRAFLAEFFITRLERQDFTPYIKSQLAGDFATALSAWLSRNQLAGAGAQDLPVVGGYAFVGFDKNGRLTVKVHASRDMAEAEAKHWEEKGSIVGVKPIILASGQVVQSPVARVVSKHGDPEAFGEREIELLVDLSKLPYNTNLFADANPGEVERLRADLAAANDKIDKAWNRKSNLDYQGYIPGALDAWKRPVKQHLPYDFSGNPGASATQYCNGWNDAGTYWKNHADDLSAKQAELEALLLEVRQSCNSSHVEMIDAAIGAPLALADATHYYPAVAGDRKYRKQIEGVWHEFCGQWLPLDTQDMAHLYVELDAAPSASAESSVPRQETHAEMRIRHKREFDALCGDGFHYQECSCGVQGSYPIEVKWCVCGKPFTSSESTSLACSHAACESLGEPHPFCDFARSHEAGTSAKREDDEEELPPIDPAMTNERCAHGVCDEAEEHDPLCTAWDDEPEQLQEPFGWIVNSPEGFEPVETFVRDRTTVEKFRQSGWTITAVEKCLKSEQEGQTK